MIAMPTKPFCHDEERRALIHFNQSFKIDCQTRVDIQNEFVPVYPKTSTWGSNSTNCCSWDGVDCDIATGHVIGLNLASSCLYGSIHSNNTLFRLVHLRKLNLNYNNFTFSHIPIAIGILSELTILELASSFFQGQVPYEISCLSKLSYLFLSGSVVGDDPTVLSLKLKNPNLVDMSTLIVNFVDMRYELGDSLANLTSLTQLELWGCGLHGPIPSSIVVIGEEIGFRTWMEGDSAEDNYINIEATWLFC
ncbi:hypothetical protein CsatB_018779 [Cannabis sativa]